MKVFTASLAVTIIAFAVFLAGNMILAPVRMAREREREFDQEMEALQAQHRQELESAEDHIATLENKLSQCEQDVDRLAGRERQTERDLAQADARRERDRYRDLLVEARETHDYDYERDPWAGETDECPCQWCDDVRAALERLLEGE